ncbi:aldo/keto reductase [Hymenobacter busanensis]|uniref:Aldo/keto reductase n=1 Tax=Hymenobacter busanensis TaxID=2607656 RepID=A0A7L4ZUU0_9BACT|nr:aldo/keto reductase [Hymenobacter busanensis]KAA9339465.1 aldo/keto reductase [Hymenobacter busanensis]QHJ06777.1 hypothetical protein GUY19_05490 [Hymenobacter busanensis]
MPVSFAERLALGTAQFGLDYGLNNLHGRPDDATVQAILAAAAEAGVSMLDTASAYGDSEVRLGVFGEQTSTLEVVTKLAGAPPAEVTQQLHTSLTRLRRRSVYGVLLHRFENLQQYPESWQALIAAQKDGLTQRIGVSLYHPAQARWLLSSDLGVDLVQVPFNVFDQRFAPLLPELATRGVEVHVRSAFLQGLLLRDLTTLPAFFEPLRPKLQQLHSLANEANIPLEAMLLLFATQTPDVARVVIGVDSVDNLRANVAAGAYADTARQLRPHLLALAEPTDQFILPYTWPPTR